jgi:hypothetical protein
VWHFWVTGRSRIWHFVMICQVSSQNEALKHTCNNAWHICSFRHRFIDIKLVKCNLSPLRRMRVVGWHERMCTRDVPGQPTNQPTRTMVCSFVSFTHYLIYLRRQIAKKIRLWRCLFALLVSFSQLIIVIWIKTSVGITTVFHMGISRAVAAG